MKSEHPIVASQAALSANIIQPQKDNPNLWEVRLLADQESQWVERMDGFYLPIGAPIRMICTCHDLAPSTCIHTCALAIHLLQQGEKAQSRRQRGLMYSGLRVNTSDGSHRQWTEPQVSVWEGEDSKPLDPKPSQTLCNHSPDGFEWGYAGSGPAQLALAMLLDYTGDVATALRYYQPFKAEVIAGLPRESGRWQITGTQIQRYFLHDLHESVFTYTGFHNAPSRCYLQWIARPQHIPAGPAQPDDSVIVIATELAENPGTSVTNRAERLANQVCREMEVAPERLIWIEHYLGNPHASRASVQQYPQERFRLVAFRLTDGRLRFPRWLPVSRDWVENFIGCPLTSAPEELTTNISDD